VPTGMSNSSAKTKERGKCFTLFFLCVFQLSEFLPSPTPPTPPTSTGRGRGSARDPVVGCEGRVGWTDRGPGETRIVFKSAEKLLQQQHQLRFCWLYKKSCGGGGGGGGGTHRC
jgi:hypothetical protein